MTAFWAKPKSFLTTKCTEMFSELSRCNQFVVQPAETRSCIAFRRAGHDATLIGRQYDQLGIPIFQKHNVLVVLAQEFQIISKCSLLHFTVFIGCSVARNQKKQRQQVFQFFHDQIIFFWSILFLSFLQCEAVYLSTQASCCKACSNKNKQQMKRRHSCKNWRQKLLCQTLDR